MIHHVTIEGDELLSDRGKKSERVAFKISVDVLKGFQTEEEMKHHIRGLVYPKPGSKARWTMDTNKAIVKHLMYKFGITKRWLEDDRVMEKLNGESDDMRG